MRGILKMKKIQFLSIILLLFGIWLCLAPVGQSSALDEYASVVSVALGMICGVTSLFLKDK